MFVEHATLKMASVYVARLLGKSTSVRSVKGSDLKGAAAGWGKFTALSLGRCAGRGSFDHAPPCWPAAATALSHGTAH